IFSFGWSPNAFGLDENIFDLVFNSTCTSKPITVSKFILVSLHCSDVSYDDSLLVQMYKRHDIIILHQNAFRLIVSQASNQVLYTRLEQIKLAGRLNLHEPSTHHSYTSSEGPLFH